MSPPRVVITGIGVVSTFGVGRDAFWDAISRGISGTRSITTFDTAGLACQVAAAVPDAGVTAAPADRDVEDAGGRADPRRYAKVSRIAVLAAREAMRDAGLDRGGAGLGVVVGSGAGGIDVAERQYGDYFAGDWHRVSPYAIPVSIVGIVSSEISIALGARGLARPFHRLHEFDRRDWLRRRTDSARRSRRPRDGRRRRVRHAGDDARLRPDARRRDPVQRPARRGVPAVRLRPRRLRAGRGRVALHAGARGPRAGARRALYASVDGYGSTCDAYHRVQMDPDGTEIVRAMQLAVARSRHGRSRPSATSIFTARRRA